MAPKGLIRGDGGVLRCSWCGEHADYVAYHDTEWGFPVDEDRRLFEKICLEGFQAGLSWLTILRKREAFRRAFAGFDFEKVARFTAKDVRRLLGDAAIVRHRGKIESVVGNARRASELIDSYGSIAAYVWRFEPDRRTRPKGPSPQSAAMSKDLKKRGWTFVGPTTVYAFMQAMGLVNDHVEGCAIRPRALAARRGFDPPEGDLVPSDLARPVRRPRR